MTPKEMAILAAKALDEKKGKEISAIEITDLTTLADYFVIATGTSNTQINALCGAVEKALKEQAGEDPLRREGYRDGTWVLLDYGCICVHVFSEEAREFYSLERLWHGGPLRRTDEGLSVLEQLHHTKCKTCKTGRQAPVRFCRKRGKREEVWMVLKNFPLFP